MKVNRLISIIMVLLDKNRMSAQELAEMFEVSSRTIYRDIEAINIAGIPVCAISGVGGGFEIMPKYKVDNKVFSAEDLSTLLLGLSSISNMVQNNELINTVAKIKSFIPANQQKDIELKASQIQIDLDPWMGNKNIQIYLQTIKTALQESKLLTFDYIDQHGNTTRRTAEPYQLVLKSTHWYWQGYCHKRKAFRLFRLSRMSNVQVEEETFAPKEYPKPELNFTDKLKTMQTKIKIRIHQSLLERVLDFCTYENLLPDKDEYYMVEFPFMEKEYYYNILLGFGNKCECLEPLHVRAEMKRRIDEIAAIYKNTKKKE